MYQDKKDNTEKSQKKDYIDIMENEKRTTETPGDGNMQKIIITALIAVAAKVLEEVLTQTCEERNNTTSIDPTIDEW